MTPNVPRAVFSYQTKTWASRKYYLPRLGDDFLLLTPTDMLTRDDTWISHSDLIRRFAQLPGAIPNSQLRAQVNQYFASRLGPKPKAKDRVAAAQTTINRFPQLIDYYIMLKELEGDGAQAVSAERVDDTHQILVAQVKLVADALEQVGGFYDKSAATYADCLLRERDKQKHSRRTSRTRTDTGLLIEVERHFRASRRFSYFSDSFRVASV